MTANTSSPIPAVEVCGVANPGRTPCQKDKGHPGGHDQDAYGPSPAVEMSEEALATRIVEAVANCVEPPGEAPGDEWWLDRARAVARVKKILGSSDAATRMREACVERVKAIHEERLRDLRALTENGEVEHEDAEYERAVLFVLGNVIDSLKSLTLDQVEEKQ